MAINYSRLETRILESLRGTSTEKRITSTDLILKVYGDAAPLNARQSIVAAVRNLSAKVDRNGSVFTIGRSENDPPKPLEYWMQKVKI